MDEICPVERCTGCSACMNICPKDAIYMQECGELGCTYPIINKDLCIDCYLCEKTCPVNNPITLYKPRKAYAAISKDMDDLVSSTSGGASSVFAQKILSQGGVVYGCVQEDYTLITHKRINSMEDAFQLKGSKYVQSHVGYIYRSIKLDLENGTLVLFTGTPCQIAGLRKYLRKKYANLYLVDLVCHGVPSQKLLRDNVEDLLCGLLSKPYVHFRKKGTKPQDLRYGIFLEKENTIPMHKQEYPKNDYITAFMSGIIFRKNCFSCPYAQSLRGSDVTIGDYWGLGESTVPIGRGVSLMMANTPKGESFITSVSQACRMEERPVEEAIKGNGQLNASSKEPPCREEFIALYAKNRRLAYAKCLKDYRSFYAKMQFKSKVLNLLRRNERIYRIVYVGYKKIIRKGIQ